MQPTSRARLVWGLLFVILCGVLIARATRKEAGVMQLNRDFGARFLAGDDPYWDAVEEERTHRPYPPSFALVCAPLSLLPEKAARASWAGLQCLALLLSYRLLARRWRKRFPERAHQAPAWFALALLLVSRFLLRDMAAGGGNLIYATLAYLALELVIDDAPSKEGTKRTWAAGALLGFALAVKPNLLPLVLLLVLLRRRLAAGAALVCATLWFLVPAAYYGPSAYFDLTQGWATDVVAFARLEDLHDSSLVPEGMPPARNGMNQSLRSAVHRLTRPPGDSGAPDVHLYELSPAASTWIARSLTLLLVLACCWKAWCARSPEDRWLAALCFFPLSLLASPITWKAHGAALLTFLFGCLWLAQTRRRGFVLLALFYVVTNLLSEELIGKEGKRDLQALSVFTWGIVWLLLTVIAQRVPSSSGENDSHTGSPARSENPPGS